MPEYNGGDMAIMSTILTAATKREWSTLASDTPCTQEEIQMLRVGDALFIAANKGGHTAVHGFLKAFAVNNNATFIESLVLSHTILRDTKPGVWLGDIGKKLGYSTQDKGTLDMFSFPDDISKEPKQTTLTTLYNCVGKQGKNAPVPTTRKDWKTGPLQYLLGVFSDNEKNKNYVKDFGKPTTPASVQGANFGTTPKLDYAVTVVTEKATVHAELKLLAVLTRLVLDGKVTVDKVQLGGAKGAWKECAKWINTYKAWLTENNIALQPPENDTRPSADPDKGAWNNPTVDSTFKEKLKGLSIEKLFD